MKKNFLFNRQTKDPKQNLNTKIKILYLLWRLPDKEVVLFCGFHKESKEVKTADELLWQKYNSFTVRIFLKRLPIRVFGFCG